MKKYEIYGIPDDAVYAPDYADVYDEDFFEKDVKDLLRKSLPFNDICLWGALDFWTALEAAFLIAGVAPNDPWLYSMIRNPEYSNNNEDDEAGDWLYGLKFDRARDLFPIFERAPFAPKAAPITWVEYVTQKQRKHESETLPFGLHRNVAGDWREFFQLEIEQLVDQSQDVGGRTEESASRRRSQHEIILALIVALDFRPMQIPDGGKAKIKAACLTIPRLFTPAGFEHAWKDGVRGHVFRLANHEKYSSNE